MRYLLTGLACISIYFLAIPLANASLSGIPLPLHTIDELIQDADVIAVGTVENHKSYLGKDNHIYTDTFLNVEYYLGKSTKKTTILIQGYGENAWIPGFQFWSEEHDALIEYGERVCVFLKSTKDGKYKIINPDGSFYLTAWDNQANRTKYEKAFATLPKVFPRKVGLSEQILIGALSLVLTLILFLKILPWRNKNVSE